MKKPVIILKGGRGKSGTRATASHTASLAGSLEVWNAAMKQAGAISVVDLEELLDVAAAFYFLPPAYRNHAGIAGGGGGGSVIAADVCEEAGLDIIPLPDEIRAELRKQNNPIWDWVTNPVDFSIALKDAVSGYITKMMVNNPNFDLSIIFIDTQGHGKVTSIDVLLSDFPLDDLKIKPLLVVLLDRGRSFKDTAGETNKQFIEISAKLIEKRIPAYVSVARAANAAVKMINYYKKQRADLTQ